MIWILLKWIGYAAVVLVLLGGAVALWGPRESVSLKPDFDPASIGPDIDAWLAAEEAVFPDIVPGTRKQVVWAGAKGAKTPLAVVYLHGFSATSQEIRPVPDQVAKALGANLFFTRLTGHGLTGAPVGDALGAAMPEQWIRDTAEALAIGRRLGDRVLVIATSTGGTLAVIAATDPQTSADVAGMVMISPNLRIKGWQARLLDLGLAPLWLPRLAGNQISFTPATTGDATYWTNTYPISALFHTAALVRAAHEVALQDARMPIVVFYAPEDATVDETHTLDFFQGWGGAVQWEQRKMTAQDDPGSHVIAGDLKSPAQTADTVQIILDWAAKSGL